MHQTEGLKRGLGAFTFAIAFAAHITASVGTFEVVTHFIKEVPIIRSFFGTGARPSASMETLLSEDKIEKPVIVEAKVDTPLRESPPVVAAGFILRKGQQIGEIQPNSEWIVVDKIKFTKITGDDIWIRIANKNDVAAQFPAYQVGSLEKLKYWLDQGENKSAGRRVRAGWAYLGNNFSPDE